MQNTFETRDPKLSLQVCALGLLLSLSAASPLAVWAAEPLAETSEPEPPVLRTTIIQTEHARLPAPIVNTGDVRVVAPGTVLEMVLGTEIESYETKAGDEFFWQNHQGRDGGWPSGDTQGLDIAWRVDCS